jgi:hypothetical protein
VPEGFASAVYALGGPKPGSEAIADPDVHSLKEELKNDRKSAHHNANTRDTIGNAAFTKD